MQARDQLRRQRQIQKQQEQEQQQGTKPENSADAKNKKSNKNDNSSAQKDPHDQKNGGQGYTMIISGLSTDLATIYRDALPRFLLPRVPVATTIVNNNTTEGEKTSQNEKKTKKNDANDEEETEEDQKSKNTPAPFKNLRPVHPAAVAFRAETCSAFISVPKDEAEKALRLMNSISNNNNNKKNTEKNTNTKKSQEEEKEVDTTATGKFVTFCKSRELFGQRVHALPAVSNHDQSSLVSVASFINKPVTAKHLTSALSPIDGFVSVIPLNHHGNTIVSHQQQQQHQQKNQNNNNDNKDTTSADVNKNQQQQQQGKNNNNNINKTQTVIVLSKHFRLVFKTEKHLFGAKKLLDEFPAADGVKVKVNLNDNSMRKFLEFVQKQDDDDKNDIVNNNEQLGSNDE